MNKDYEQLISELDRLPSGGITYKTINGKRYAYYQWSELGKQRARRVKDDEMDSLSEGIAKRKEIQMQLKEAEYNNYKGASVRGLAGAGTNVVLSDAGARGLAGAGTNVVLSDAGAHEFACPVRLGAELVRFARSVEGWKKRACYDELREYIWGDACDRVFILYGLRRTGKTTLIRQIILEMDQAMRERAAFVQVQDGVGMADINRDLRFLEQAGYRYVFIDEVTLMEGFIGGAALFSDIYVASGMKIVLSGTDSLGFRMAEDEELYDRCILSHTTFIPYREFEAVLGVNGIDSYIRYGGTMSLGGTRYNEGIFSSQKSTGEYVDSAISHNIQHSLRNYDYERHFGPLNDLYRRGELTSAINRVVEDINHRFTLEVLTRDWSSTDLRISAANLRKDRQQPSSALDDVNIDRELKELLEIRNRAEQSIELNDEIAAWIREYMDLLDLTVDVETRFMNDFNHIEKRTVLTQPGLRYSQADALVRSLIEDDHFRELVLAERKRIIERVRSEIKGRMLEDIVLLETLIAKPNTEVFSLKFAIGEFDMVVFDEDNACCEIYEIKHCDKLVPAQAGHLLDAKKCEEVERRYGQIMGKYVLYRGESKSMDGIEYMNVEEYLRRLGQR